MFLIQVIRAHWDIPGNVEQEGLSLFVKVRLIRSSLMGIDNCDDNNLLIPIKNMIHSRLIFLHYRLYFATDSDKQTD